jgi:hypothetical protein
MAGRRSTIDHKAHDHHLLNLQPLLPIAKLLRERSYRIPRSINSLVRGDQISPGSPDRHLLAVTARAGVQITPSHQSLERLLIPARRVRLSAADWAL